MALGVNKAGQAAAVWWRNRPRGAGQTRPLLTSAMITLFITGSGTWLADRYQTQAWTREKQFAVFQQNFEGGFALIDDLAEHMGTRFMGLNRVIWAAEDGQLDNLEQLWDEYYGSVAGWNAKLLRYKGQLTRFIGPETAETFCSREDYHLTSADSNPESIHGLFLISQQRVRALMDCVQSRCAPDARARALRDASQAVDLLEVAIEDFLTTATETVYERAQHEDGSAGGRG